MTTNYSNDCQLFNHDNRSIDLIDFLPPVGNMTDDEYQDLAEQRMDFFSGTAYPKPENTLAYGECWIGAAKHASDMSSLDRMIYEDCYNGSSSIQRQGMNVPQIPRFHRIEYVAGLIKSTLDQAEDLIDYFKIIDDSGRLWPEFIRWTQTKGIEPALEYFENLAAELTSDNCHVNDRPFSNGDPFTDVETDFDQDQVVEVLESDGEFNFKINSLADLEEAWQSLTFAGEDDQADLLPHEVEAVFDKYSFATEDGRFILDRGFASPEVFKYARMNHQEDPAEITPAIDPETGERTYKTFMSRQPEKFKKLLRYIDRAKLKDLNELRKKAFKKLNWMSPVQKRVFWSHTQTRKSYLEMLKTCYISKLMKNLDRVEHQTLTMIRNTKSAKQARYYWYLIYSALKGERYMGRKGFLEYVLKPELDKAQQRFAGTS